MKLFAVVLACLMVAYGGAAFAQPKFTPVVIGKRIWIKVENPDDRSYSCSLTWRYYYRTKFGGEESYLELKPNSPVRAHFSGEYSHYSVEEAYDNWAWVGEPKCAVNERPPVFENPSWSNCPAGLEYIGHDYGAANPSGEAMFKLGSIRFERGYKLDMRSRVQDGPVHVAAGGAVSPWDGESEIPNGIHLVATGGHYWSVGQGPKGYEPPKLTQKDQGFPLELTIGMYCGPAGAPGPGCNVRVEVCAKRL